MKLTLVLAFLFLATCSNAQHAVIKGEVYASRTLILLDSVNVTLVSLDSTFNYTTTSDNEGNFEFTDLPESTYNVEFSRKGFDVRQVSNVVIVENKIHFQDAQLDRTKKIKTKKRKKKRN